MQITVNREVSALAVGTATRNLQTISDALTDAQLTSFALLLAKISPKSREKLAKVANDKTADQIDNLLRLA